MRELSRIERGKINKKMDTRKWSELKSRPSGGNCAKRNYFIEAWSWWLGNFPWLSVKPSHDWISHSTTESAVLWTTEPAVLWTTESAVLWTTESAVLWTTESAVLWSSDGPLHWPLTANARLLNPVWLLLIWGLFDARRAHFLRFLLQLCIVTDDNWLTWTD